MSKNDYYDNASEDTDPQQGTSLIYTIHSNFHVQPPLISNHLSKTPKVSQSKPYFLAKYL